MILEKYLTGNKTLVAVTQFVLLLSLSIAAPLAHNQIITGSIVNTILFISVFTLGLPGAVLICLVPSVFALLSGTLPVILLPFIPFIMVANIILVLSFKHLKKYNFWLGMFGASLLKFIFLFLVSFQASQIAATVLGSIQFLTASLGGLIAYFVLKFSKLSYGK